MQKWFNEYEMLEKTIKFVLKKLVSTVQYHEGKFTE